MKYSLLLFFILINNAYASNLTLQIEKETAKRNNCSIKQPCIITVTKNKDGYQASVIYGGIITEYGVLKFIPGKVYYSYNLEGKFLSSMPTP